MKNILAGIDIGGTKIAIATATPDGELLDKRFLPTQTHLGPEAVFENMCRAVVEMLGDDADKLAAIGVGSPAPIDVEKGLILSPSNLQDWDRFPIVDLLNERFDVPVVLDNDANAAALGEFMFGAGRGCRDVLYVTVSTGIGGGIIINGEIYHGVSTGAGEIGHTVVRPDDGILCNCGLRGCLESICAGVHIARRTKERLAAGESSVIRDMLSDIEDVTAETVVEAVRQNDRLATEIWDETCRYLAIGIGNAVTLLAPEIVIVGGGISMAGELLMEPLRRLVPRCVSMIPPEKIRIRRAELGAESGLHGAVAIARKAYSGSHLMYAV